MDEYELEIFREGQHVSSDGVALLATNEVLNQIASNYDPGRFKAPLIVGHCTPGYSDIELIDSQLSFGYPKALKIEGDRVKAVFDPDKISYQFREWVGKGAILGISCSLYPPDHPNNPFPGEFALRHIAGTGVQPPAIKGLQGLEALGFSEKEGNLQGTFPLSEFSYTFSEEGTWNDSLRGVILTPKAKEFAEIGIRAYNAMGAIGAILQRMRDRAIEASGVDTAEEDFPAELLHLVNQDASKPWEDYPLSRREFEETITRYSRELDSLRNYLYEIAEKSNGTTAVKPLNTIYAYSEGGVTTMGESEEMKVLRAEMGALKAELDSLKQTEQKRQNLSFTEELIQERKLIDAEKPWALSFLEEATTDEDLNKRKQILSSKPAQPLPTPPGRIKIDLVNAPNFSEPVTLPTGLDFKDVDANSLGDDAKIQAIARERSLTYTEAYDVAVREQLI